MLGFPAGWFGAEFSWLEILGAGIWMLGIQYLLLNTHKARKVLPVEVVPSQSEIYVAITCLWFAFLTSTKTLLHVVNFIFWVLPNFEPDDKPVSNADDVSVSRSEVVGWIIFSTNFGFQLFNLIMLTWQIHQLTLHILENTIPFLATLTTTEFSKTLQSLHTRLNALITFLNLVTTGHPMPAQKYFQSPLASYSINSSSTQITLKQKRAETPLPSQNERTLSWTLTIPPPLLDEMKETLGPPGGFGELGFWVGKSEVRFEGMGVGTSFGLIFDVDVGATEGSEAGSVKEETVKEIGTGRSKKRESRRRKTK